MEKTFFVKIRCAQTDFQSALDGVCDYVENCPPGQLSLYAAQKLSDAGQIVLSRIDPAADLDTLALCGMEHRAMEILEGMLVVVREPTSKTWQTINRLRRIADHLEREITSWNNRSGA